MRELKENELRSVEGGKQFPWKEVFRLIGEEVALKVAKEIYEGFKEYDHDWDTINTPH